ncbi:MAG: SDR family oxidoreductase [Gammaproteobacteria bacterium]|jgi:NAD(P)-dependent dehydrogenase (short-subunit alcohol dehydrogenase family)|nr:SDR family oxidoreductase [Gammaproteobacteria bacterium]
MKGNVALITGGAGGIGFAAAKLFAQNGASVAIADVSQESIDRVTASFADDGHEILGITMDVSNAEECAAMTEEVLSAFGRLDYAFNNAGITEVSVFGDSLPETHLLEPADWGKILGVNLDGVFHCIRAELRPMLDNGGGAIINTASIQSKVAFARSAAYTTAKHGVIGLTKTIAKEYGNRGIRCNAISPGIVNTPLTRNAVDVGGFDEADLVAPVPLGRMAEPEDIAETALWLCSEAARYVNGANIVVDGGFLS